MKLFPTSNFVIKEGIRLIRVRYKGVIVYNTSVDPIVH